MVKQTLNHERGLPDFCLFAAEFIALCILTDRETATRFTVEASDADAHIVNIWNIESRRIEHLVETVGPLQTLDIEIHQLVTALHFIEQIRACASAEEDRVVEAAKRVASDYT